MTSLRLLRPLATLLLNLLCLSSLAFAQPLVLTAESSGLLLNSHIELLEDVDGQLSIEAIQHAQVQARFQPANGRASVGQSENPWWIKVQLKRDADAPQDWWLEASGTNLLDLRLYLPDGHGGWQERLSGAQVPFISGRDHQYRRPVFKLPALEGELTFYVRSYDPAGNAFPLYLWQLDDLQQQQNTDSLLMGLIYGAILALLLYNLFILITLRDLTYFWYVCTTAFALLFVLSATGHGFQYLWPNQAVAVWLDRITLPAMWGLCASLFTQALLQTRRFVPWAHHLLTLGCWLYALAIVLEVLNHRAWAAGILNLLTITSIPAAFSAALIRSMQGFIPARLYLAGYGLVLGSVILLTLRAMGLVQPTPLNSIVFPLAVAAETILFSFALAYRIQLLKRDRNVARDTANSEKLARLEQIQASADSLQSAVDERTAELAAANLRLSERERELRHAAFHDALTELPNRRYLIEHAGLSLADAKRRKESMALLLIDLDLFKPINDQYGHDAGDQMLCAIAQRLQLHVRCNDMPARLGGDEFAVLVSGPDAHLHAQEIAKRLLHELEQPVLYNGAPLQVSVSIGAALYPLHGEDFSSLNKAADQALYQVKSAGRNGFALCGAIDE